jgi:hypothetical protein
LIALAIGCRRLGGHFPQEHDRRLLLEGAGGERLSGSLAAAVIAAWQGARIIRAHDVRETVQALRVCAADAGGRLSRSGSGLAIFKSRQRGVCALPYPRYNDFE